MTVSKMMFDIVLLADSRYVNPEKKNVYVNNVLQEDQVLTDALVKEGFRVGRKAWDDPTFDWSTTRYAIFRATWDYFDRYGEFFQWFQQAAKQTQFINSKALIRWNMDKHYLKDLQVKKVHVPKTLFVETGETIGLLEAIIKAKNELHFKGDTFVIKPCIAGGARHTYKFHETEWEHYDPIFQKLIREEAMMLQEFQQRIVSDGEVSMMVFGGQYTHAILKIAKPGDFRVQDDFGGSVQEYHPSKEEIDFAEHAFAQCPEMPMYGRADIFKDNDGKLALAELEIFEPELWFRFYPKAATLFAQQLKKQIDT